MSAWLIFAFPLLITALDSFDLGLTTTLIPMVAHHYQFSPTTATLSQAMPLLGSLPFSLFLVVVGDRVSRKTTLVIGGSCFLAGSLLSACSWSPVSHLFFRFLYGFGIPFSLAGLFMVHESGQHLHHVLLLGEKFCTIAVHVAGMVLGLFVEEITASFHACGSECWRYGFAVEAGIAALALGGVLGFVPAMMPQALAAGAADEADQEKSGALHERAVKAQLKLFPKRGEDEAKERVAEMMEAHRALSESTTPPQTRGFTTGLILVVFAQLNGFPSILHLLAELLERWSFGFHGPQSATRAAALLGSCRLLWAVLAWLVLHRTRVTLRSMLLFGSGLIFFSLSFASFSFHVAQPALLMFSLMLLTLGFTASFGFAGELIHSLIEDRHRAKCIGGLQFVSTAVNCGMLFTLLPLSVSYGETTVFALYAVVSIGAILFIWKGLKIDQATEQEFSL
jgi:MFS family permease